MMTHGWILSALLAVVVAAPLTASDGLAQDVPDGGGSLSGADPPTARVDPRLMVDPRLLPSASPFAVAGQEPGADRPSTPLMVAAGLVGGGIGVLGGGFLGAAIADDTCEGEGCFAGIIQGAFIGAAAAESVLLPLGVHLAAGKKGDLGTSLAASLGLGALGVGIAYATHVDDPLGAGLLMAVPVAQITVSILEHR